MRVREMLITALENALNERGFADVYSRCVRCRDCPVYNKCKSSYDNQIKMFDGCSEYIERLMKEGTSNADSD